MAKLYPDWINGRFPGFLLKRFHQPYLSWLTYNHYFQLLIAWGGILFDFSIVPLLLYKRTRNIGAILSVGFHSFNWIMLNIGIFPFLSLSYLVFFYPPDTVRKFFLPKKPPLTEDELNTTDTSSRNLLRYFFIPYFIIQLALPVRHLFIKGDAIWTEEGHRLAWRMMQKNRRGSAIFTVKDRTAKKEFIYNISKLLTSMQIKSMSDKPDMIWQTAQMIKNEYAKKGHDVEVYVTARASINKRPYRLLIDPKVNLAHTKWDYFTHSEWVILYDE